MTRPDWFRVLLVLAAGALAYWLLVELPS